MSLLMFEDVFSFVRGKDGGYVSKEVSGVRMLSLSLWITEKSTGNGW